MNFQKVACASAIHSHRAPPKTPVVVQVEMVPFVLPVVGLILVVAQIVYGEVPQKL